VYYSECQFEACKYEKKQQEKKKESMIISANAIVYPRAVMIINFYTSLAGKAMFSPYWLKTLALKTYSLWFIFLQKIQ